MAFFIRKSMAFLLLIVLLLCRFSCAEDCSQVGGKGRKLLGPFNVVGEVGRASRAGSNFGKTMSHDLPKDTAPYEYTHNLPKLDPPKYPQSHNLPTLDHNYEKGTKFGVKNTGEFMAFKLFGRNGLRRFKIGWKAGKRIYSIEKKCQKLEDEVAKWPESDVPPTFNIQCDQGDCDSKFCIVRMIERGLNVVGWSGSSQQPQETPCTYYNGSVYDSNNNLVFIKDQIQTTCSS